MKTKAQEKPVLDGETWVNAAVACSVLGTNYRRLRAMVQAGTIRKRQYAGGHPAYALSDCQRAAASAVAVA